MLNDEEVKKILFTLTLARNALKKQEGQEKNVEYCNECIRLIEMSLIGSVSSTG